jgi:DNA-directed RNA polymerase specialized sigma24 family protein
MSQVIPFPKKHPNLTKRSPEKEAVYKAADALHRTHFKRLCRKAAHILGGYASDAQDAVQDAFAAFLDLPALPKGKPESYLVAILRRVCRERLAIEHVHRQIRDESRAELGDGNRRVVPLIATEEFSLRRHAFFSYT